MSEMEEIKTIVANLVVDSLICFENCPSCKGKCMGLRRSYVTQCTNTECRKMFKRNDDQDSTYLSEIKG